MGPCKRAVGIYQALFVQRDLSPMQHELPLLGTYQRHRIRDQHVALGALATNGNTQAGRVNVDAVADDPCK
jgi:hypothetical protein